MAKATITYTCKVCGKQTTESVTKYNRREADSWEAWAAAHIDTCPDCRRAAQKADRETKISAAFTEFCGRSDVKLVELSGSPKQIAWAETIRRDCIALSVIEWDDLIPTETIMCINSKPAASWWIDHRGMSATEMLNTIAGEYFGEQP